MCFRVGEGPRSGHSRPSRHRGGGGGGRLGLLKPPPRAHGGAVDLLVAAHDGVDAEALLARAAARRGVDLVEPADRRGHRVLVVDDEARPAVLDDLGRRALRERDHRRAAGQRLDHHEAERLGPADRHQQRPGARGRARACARRRPRRRTRSPSRPRCGSTSSAKNCLLPRLHRPGEHEPDAGLARGGDRAVRALVGRHAPDPQHEVVLVGAGTATRRVDRVGHDAAAAHLGRRVVELGLRDRDDARLAAVLGVEAARRLVERPVQRVHQRRRRRGRPWRARCGRVVVDDVEGLAALGGRVDRREGARDVVGPRTAPSGSRPDAAPRAPRRPRRATRSRAARTASRRGRARRGRRTAGARPPRSRRRPGAGTGIQGGASMAMRSGPPSGSAVNRHLRSPAAEVRPVVPDRGYPIGERHASRQNGHAAPMSLEAHATAAGAGHPPAEAEPPPGALVNLAETDRDQGGERLRRLPPRRLAARRRSRIRSGVYRDDCRFLSGHELRVNGVRPRLLVASAAPGSESVHELTNPALPLPGGRVLPLQSLQIRLERRIAGDDEVEETLLVHSYDREPLELDLDLLLAADFEPMLAHPRHRRDRRRPARRRRATSPDGVRFATRGRDGAPRARRSSPTAPCEPGERRGSLRFALALDARRRRDDPPALRLHEGEPRRRRRSPAAAAPRARRSARRAGWPSARSSRRDDELFNRVLRRSLLDIRMLHSRHGGDGYYAAGVPWYATLFGRDSLITATQMLAFDPPMAAQTLRVLAAAARHARRPGARRGARQGAARAARRRGRAPAASRRSPATTARSTPRRCSSACCPTTRTGPATWRCSASCAAEVEAMLGWIDGPGDRDGDGLLDYQQRAPDRPAQPGLEGLRRGRARRARRAARAADRARRAAGLRAARQAPAGAAVRARRRRSRAREQLLREAAALRERLERFWLPERGFYSMGFGADGRPSAALASNQGHLLWAPRRRRRSAPRAVRDALMSPTRCSRAGGSARWPRARPATTRSATTSARSGRTTRR